LVTTDRRSGEILTRERAIDELIRNANHPDINPYLMPNDGIACYDSGATNAGDIAKLISVMLSPALILDKLLD
ncbi:MAG: polysaccharide export protein, partial [Gammaproteobacteria bacterium]|nr:polysaccharide export protein [Gammaproteobacteria bacterium]